MNIAILQLKELLDNLIAWVVADQNSASSTSDKWLYSVFNGVTNGNYDYHTQILDILLRGDDDSDKLETRLMFDSTRANLPTIHIHLPSEKKGTFNSIGKGAQLTDTLIDDNVVECFEQSYISTYDLIITGANTDEIILIYEFLKAILTAGALTVANTFELFDYSGAELMTNSELIPYLTFYRAISVTVQNRITVKAVGTIPTIGDLNFEGTPIDG